MSANPYRASPSLKALLARFGEVMAVTSFYAAARPAGPTERPGENFTSLVDLEPGEPALVVKISNDGGFRIEKAVDPTDVDSNISVWSFPKTSSGSSRPSGHRCPG